MKKNNDINTFLLNRNDIEVPDVGLGEFIEGYTTRNIAFNLNWLWWLLLPIAGVVVLLIVVLIYLFKILNPYYFLIYENGILTIRQSRSKSLSSNGKIVKFDEINGINIAKTRNYTNGIYTGTACSASFFGSKDNKRHLFYSGSYYNESEISDKPNLTALVIKAIINMWTPIALNRHYSEFRRKGYTEFYSKSPEKSYQLGNDYIKYKDNTLTISAIKYRWYDGSLILYSQIKHQKKIVIPVNLLYDNYAFLYLINECYGIS